MAKKLFDNLRKRLNRRRLIFKKAERSGARASDVKKVNDDLAELNLIIWLVPYVQSGATKTNLPHDESTSNRLTDRCRKESNYEIESDGNDKDTFENENISNSSNNETSDADNESVCGTAITNRKKSLFKKRKKLPVKDSDLQKAEMDFLRAMKGYAENEKEKDENDVFSVLIATKLKKLSKKKQIMAKRKIQNLIYNMQMEDEELQNKRNNFDTNRPTVNYSNPVSTFPRF